MWIAPKMCDHCRKVDLNTFTITAKVDIEDNDLLNSYIFYPQKRKTPFD